MYKRHVYAVACPSFGMDDREVTAICFEMEQYDNSLQMPCSVFWRAARAIRQRNQVVLDEQPLPLRFPDTPFAAYVSFAELVTRADACKCSLEIIVALIECAELGADNQPGVTEHKAAAIEIIRNACVRALKRA